VSGPLKVFAGHIDFCQVLTSCWQLCRSPWPWRSLYWTHRAPQGLSNPKHWRAEYFLLKWDNHVEWGCLPSQLYFPCRWNISVLFNPIRFSFGLVTGHILSKGKSSLDLLGCWTTLVGRDKRFDSLYEVLDSASKGGSPNLLCLMQNKLNLLISGFASVLEPLWQAKTKNPSLYATCLSVHARAAPHACADR